MLLKDTIKVMIFQNQLVWEIRRFYTEEYQVAKKSISIINHALDINLSEDEASFIALHIINAEINGKEIQSVVEMTKLIKDICNIVQYEFNIEFDEESLTYTRFILHLKFFSQRLLLHEHTMEEAAFLFDQVEQNMSDAFLCAKKDFYLHQKNVMNMKSQKVRSYILPFISNDY